MTSGITGYPGLLKIIILAVGLIGLSCGGAAGPVIPASSQLVMRVPAGPAAQLGAIPAFPGAEGWGATSVGGRGGFLYEVTNLNDSGPGSLRLGAEGNIPRTIVFRVAGIIELNGPIRINQPYITIAGQTAPGGGITLRGGGLLISSHDVIIRHLRFRGGANSFVTMRPWSDLHDVIIDHCSVGAGEDDTIDIYFNDPGGPDMMNISVQNCLIAEAHRVHPSALVTGGTVDLSADPPTLDHLRLHHISIHSNYFVHNGWRNPLIKSQYTEVVNNVVYNWSDRIGGTGYRAESDWINNYWKAGPMSNPTKALVFEFFDERAPIPFPPSSNYIAGNIIPTYGVTSPDQDNWFLFQEHEARFGRGGGPVSLDNRRSAPLPPAPFPVSIEPALIMVDSTVRNAGANQRLNADGTFSDASDEVDRQFMDDFFTGTGPIRSPGAATLPSSISAGTPYADTDKDGMADEWEKLNGFDPNDPTDGPLDADGDGYTNLEEFLNGTVPVSTEAGPSLTPRPTSTPIVKPEVTGAPEPTVGRPQDSATLAPSSTREPVLAPGTNVQIWFLAKDSELPRPKETGDGFISVTVAPEATTCEDSASIEVNLPLAGNYYVWLHLKASAAGSNALVFGVDGSGDRVPADVAGEFVWARVETSDDSGRYDFGLQKGSHALRCGPGDDVSTLDAIYLTNDPNPSAPGTDVPTKGPTATVAPPTPTPTIPGANPTEQPAPTPGSTGPTKGGGVPTVVWLLIVVVLALGVLGGLWASRRRRA